MNRSFLVLISLAVFLIQVACIQSTDEGIQTSTRVTTDPAPVLAPATVESVEIVPSLGPPVEVILNVSGSLPNNCSSIDQIQQERNGNNFQIRIQSLQQDGIECSANRTRFERAISLDVDYLTAGIYTVDVNGLNGTFRIPRQNIEDPANAVVGGFIWHDLCLAAGDSASNDTSVETGCVDIGNGLLETNDFMDSWESGIGGVIVQLGEGRCPSNDLATTITDSHGFYIFGGLRAGSYCITVDSNHAENLVALAEGNWTMQDSSEVAENSIELDIGENRLDNNFGWKIKPAPVEIVLPREDPCTNKALFIDDMTIPDDTVIRPTVSFTKTWQLRNIGSCDWTTNYQIVFFEGDQLNGPDVVPFQDVVKPGDDVDLSILLTAPAEEGNYSGAWKLRNEDGDLFGIGPGSDKAFWVRIIVDN